MVPVPPFPIPVSAAETARAKAFLLERWQERATELGRPIPTDLSSACKFVSMFAVKVFGGRLRGNHDHQFVELDDGTILDLAGDAGEVDEIRAARRDPYRHDRMFFGNRDHRESMRSCKPRVDRWIQAYANLLASNAIGTVTDADHGNTAAAPRR